jgi:hypothetical protein
MNSILSKITQHYFAEIKKIIDDPKMNIYSIEAIFKKDVTMLLDPKQNTSYNRVSKIVKDIFSLYPAQAHSPDKFNRLMILLSTYPSLSEELKSKLYSDIASKYYHVVHQKLNSFVVLSSHEIKEIVYRAIRDNKRPTDILKFKKTLTKDQIAKAETVFENFDAFVRMHINR